MYLKSLSYVQDVRWKQKQKALFIRVDREPRELIYFPLCFHFYRTVLDLMRFFSRNLKQQVVSLPFTYDLESALKLLALQYLTPLGVPSEAY